MPRYTCEVLLTYIDLEPDECVLFGNKFRPRNEGIRESDQHILWYDHIPAVDRNDTARIEGVIIHSSAAWVRFLCIKNLEWM